MALESIAKLMQDAQHHDYAGGYFESWNLDSLQGVIDAAEQSHSPIIIGFNGEFLSQRAGASAEELALYGAVGGAIAAKANVPCGFIFNECSNDAWIERAITAGSNLVMPADPGAAAGQYTRRVKRLTALAPTRGVAIEAEVEKSAAGGDHEAATDSDDAAKFIRATGVDLLAVHVGNEEIKLEGRAPLDLALLGDGSETDVIVVGRSIIRDAVLERIELLGCCGKA